MRNLGCILLVVGVLAIGSGQARQPIERQGRPTPGVPARDRGLPAQKGTGTIEGLVVDDATGLGLPRAIVELAGRGGPPGTTRSDDDGVFVFRELAPGPYVVSATRHGYTPLRQGPPESLLRASRRDNAITLADGERRRGVRIALGRAAVITGVIRDAFGDPVEHAQVVASRAARPSSLFRGGLSTNDLGEYRIAGLAPGRYVVCAAPRMTQPVDEPRKPVETCYPGTAIKTDAVAVSVERGQTVSGIEIGLLDRDVVPVTGRVTGRDGLAVSSVHLTVVETTKDGAMRSGSGTSVRPDGTFRILLVPGVYAIEARGFRPTATDGPERQEIGAATVTVDADPVSDVEVRLGPGSRVTGRLVFDGRSPLPGPGQVTVSTARTGPGGVCITQAPSSVAEDWSFVLPSVWGTCRLQAWAGRWMLRDVVLAGRVLRDRQLTLSGEAVRDVQIVFTDRRSSLSFEVTDERGAPTGDFVALVFTTSREEWGRPGTSTLTFVPRDPRSASLDLPPGPAPVPGPPGPRADLPTVLPGDYYVAAVDDVSWEDTRDADYLARVAESAVRVTLAEGEHRVVPLRRLALADER